MLNVRVYTTPATMRTRNQDRALVARRIVEQTDDPEPVALDVPTLIGVFDGLGGHPAGDVASELAAAVVSDGSLPDGPESVSALLEHAHRILIEAAVRDRHLTGMGTTAVVAVVGSDEVLVANVGDSTAWQLSDGDLLELTVSDRSGFRLAQCLGGYEHDIGITTHTRQATLEGGDRLLLASDGLTDVVPPDWIAAALAQDDLDAATRRLVDAVEQAGVPDDLTVVVAEMDR